MDAKPFLGGLKEVRQIAAPVFTRDLAKIVKHPHHNTNGRREYAAASVKWTWIVIV